ncbi:ARL14 effector protein-like [Aotus nancymaae]|uniref:ARL14 effector protein-like n=1 Tax=Aotus nancymaae TaxID=37293 RepID=UPI0030FE4F72
MMDPCSVGVQLRTTNECHKTYYTRHTGFKTLQELSSNDMLLLQLRTGMTLSGNNTICFHHVKIYIDRFEDLQKSCCDPFNIHKKLAKKNLHAIDLDDATFLSEKFGRQLVPGWKLCPKCTQIINGSVDVDTDDCQRRKPESDGRTVKALRSLQFTNPGRQTVSIPMYLHKRNETDVLGEAAKEKGLTECLRKLVISHIQTGTTNLGRILQKQRKQVSRRHYGG